MVTNPEFFVNLVTKTTSEFWALVQFPDVNVDVAIERARSLQAGLPLFHVRLYGTNKDGTNYPIAV